MGKGVNNKEVPIGRRNGPGGSGGTIPKPIIPGQWSNGAYKPPPNANMGGSGATSLPPQLSLANPAGEIDRREMVVKPPSEPPVWMPPVQTEHPFTDQAVPMQDEVIGPNFLTDALNPVNLTDRLRQLALDAANPNRAARLNQRVDNRMQRAGSLADRAAALGDTRPGQLAALQRAIARLRGTVPNSTQVPPELMPVDPYQLP